MNGIKLFGDLIRYRLSLAVTFSAVTGYSIYDSPADWSIFFLGSGVFLLSAGSAALNQYSESDYDAMMERTMNRPIPGLRIKSRNALLISLILLLSGFASLLITGFVPSLLGITAVILYNVVYTKLKRISSLAVIPGALVGAIPPVIGFTAAGGIVPQLNIIIFSLFMFLWQLPHFWLIIIKYRSDYKAAGFKALPDHISLKQVRMLVFVWMAISTLILTFLTSSGMIFSNPLNIIIISLNIIFIFLFYVFLFGKNEKKSVTDAFILINSFSMAIMFLFIMNSFLN